MDNPGKILLFPVPLQGHINPMIQLAHILHSRGFQISIIHTKYNSSSLANYYPQFSVHIIPDGLSDGVVLTSDLTVLLKLLNANCVGPLRACLAELVKNDRIVGLIADTSWYFTQCLADEFRIPRIVLRTTCVSSFLVFAALTLLREKYFLNKFDSKREEELVLEFPPLKVKDIPVIESSENTYKIIENIINDTKKASGIIFNTFKEIEEFEICRLNETFPVPSFYIGPLHKSFSAASSSLLTQDRTSISWLDTQAPKSVLYISFGSIASMDSQELVEVAWGIANSMQPFLWVVRPGLVKGSNCLEILPNEFLEVTSKRGYIVQWASQQEVLSHPAIGGFWTHSGWNSTLESICEGVPMICSAFFGDQMVNCRYVSDFWKIGIKLEKGFESREIEDAIRKVMIEREGKEMRQRVMCLKEKGDTCLRLGGSSYQSIDHLVCFICSFRPNDG